MSDELKELMESIRGKLQAELEGQLTAVSERHGKALSDARRAAEEEAEHRFAARVETMRLEARKHMEATIEHVRGEAERERVAQLTQARTEAEQHAAEAQRRIAEIEQRAAESDRRAAEAERVRKEVEHLAVQSANILRREAEQRTVDAVNQLRQEMDVRVAEAGARAHQEAEQRASETAARVQQESEQRLAEALARERQAAEQKFAEAVSREREDAERRLNEALERTRQEAEQHLRDSTTRLQQEAEQRADEAAARVRAEMEQAFAAERQQAQAREEGERRSAADELSRARAAFDAEINAVRAGHEATLAARLEEAATAAAAAPSVAPVTAATPSAERLIAALREIDAAATVSATLVAIGRAAAREASRAALFLTTGDQLNEWSIPGVPALTKAPLARTDAGLGVLGEALQRGALSRSDNGGAPQFASLPSGAAAAAAPLLLDGQAVAVLYGDEPDGEPGSPGWSDSLDVIAAHGSARLGYLTALRTAQAMHWLGGNGGASSVTSDASPSSEGEDQAARRYARLLLSEIKLYNEGAVRMGCEKRDLLRRLDAEIERARRLFEERVPSSVEGRAQVFHSELVQTLAGGDPALLG